MEKKNNWIENLKYLIYSLGNLSLSRTQIEELSYVAYY